MHIAYQPVVEVLSDTLALMTRRERAVWSFHDANTVILAIARGRIKVPPYTNHSMSQVGLMEKLTYRSGRMPRLKP
jgi:hypothetical protein